MTRALRTIVLLLFILYVQSGPVQWVAYGLFADNVAAAYCINPDRPACHGRCHMSALTRGGEKKDAPVVEIAIHKLIPFTLDGAPNHPAATISIRYRTPDRSRYSSGYPPGIDHPPLSRC
ncbi:MAG: hypothetical protein ABIR47_09605 [Candidatus Kapaibacterium sp.]